MDRGEWRRVIFRSHAQMYEDLVLSWALRQVQRGFYIDVGAQHPNRESVTKLFYSRGWNGINIEPVGHWYEQLAAQRPRDINLQLAAGVTQGETVFYEIPESGLSTTSARFAERHRQAGWAIRRTRVMTRPLAEICSEYVREEIHFLKIDAEGSECMVLEGCDFVRYRPWIVLIEATEPLTQVPAYRESERILVTAGYAFAGTDFLNRYYVARERASLQGQLAAGIWMAKQGIRLLRLLGRL